MVWIRAAPGQPPRVLGRYGRSCYIGVDAGGSAVAPWWVRTQCLPSAVPLAVLLAAMGPSKPALSSLLRLPYATTLESLLGFRGCGKVGTRGGQGRVLVPGSSPRPGTDTPAGRYLSGSFQGSRNCPLQGQRKHWLPTPLR